MAATCYCDAPPMCDLGLADAIASCVFLVAFTLSGAQAVSPTETQDSPATAGGCGGNGRTEWADGGRPTWRFPAEGGTALGPPRAILEPCLRTMRIHSSGKLYLECGKVEEVLVVGVTLEI